MTRSVPLLKCLRVGRRVVVLLSLVAVASLGLSCQPKIFQPVETRLWLDKEARARAVATLRNIPGVLEVKFHGRHLSVYTTEPSTVPQSIEGVPVYTFPPAITALWDIPGVVAVEEGRALIYVYTTQPADVPQSIEGIPIRTALPPRLLQR